MDNITDTFATTLYAIQDNNGNLINTKNRCFYITRIDARNARRSLKRKDIRIVKCEFTSQNVWTTAK